MNELPEPMTPADCDLTDFPFMPLDVARLRDSDLASDESPESCWAAVLLWAASWHQVPAASIPDNDNWIAKQAGYAQRGKIAREWTGVRPGALRGWVKCADGRLYHPVVAEKARDAWQAKVEQRWRSECGRIKKHNQRHQTTIPLPDFVSWTEAGRPTGQPLPVPRDKPKKTGDKGGDSDSKRQGEGQGQGESIKPSVPNGTGAEAPPEGLQPKDAIFQVALPWLIERGMADKSARSLLGAACKELGDEGAWALASDCMQKAPLEPASWLSATLNSRMKTAGKGKPDKFAVAGLDHSSSRAAAEASMRKHGIVVPDNDEIPL